MSKLRKQSNDWDEELNGAGWGQQAGLIAIRMIEVFWRHEADYILQRLRELVIQIKDTEWRRRYATSDEITSWNKACKVLCLATQDLILSASKYRCIQRVYWTQWNCDLKVIVHILSGWKCRSILLRHAAMQYGEYAIVNSGKAWTNILGSIFG